MKHISEIIEDILVEWAYRVHNGMPNIKNPLHIVQLRESMEELNLPNKPSINSYGYFFSIKRFLSSIKCIGFL